MPERKSKNSDAEVATVSVNDERLLSCRSMTAGAVMRAGYTDRYEASAKQNIVATFRPPMALFIAPTMAKDVKLALDLDVATNSEKGDSKALPC